MNSQGNLAGIAAPSASQLAPDAHRPGFHLTRFTSPPPKAPKPLKSPKPSRVLQPRPSSFHSGQNTASVSPTPTIGGFFTEGATSSAPTSPMLGPGDSPPTLLVPPRPRTTSPGPIERPASLHIPRPTPTPFTSNSFSENAKKRRSASGIKQIETLALNMIPLKLTKSRTTATTPDSRLSGEYGDYFGPAKSPKPVLSQEEREKKEWEKEKRRRRKAKEKRRKEQVFITQHVAAILERQDFLMKLTRALMCFGAPSQSVPGFFQVPYLVLV